MLYDCLIVLVFLSHLLELSEGRVISENVSGLSDDPETEFIPGTVTSSHNLTLCPYNSTMLGDGRDNLRCSLSLP